MIKILLGMLIIISSVVYTGDLAELKNINSLFVDETKNIVKKCVNNIKEKTLKPQYLILI